MSPQTKSGHVTQVEIYFKENLQSMPFDAALNYARSRVGDGLNLNHDDVRDLPDESVDETWRAQKLVELEHAMAEVDNYDFSTLVAETAVEISNSANGPHQVVSNRTVILSSGSLIAIIDAYREEARQSNEIGEHKDELLDFLDRLKSKIEELLVAVPVEGSANETAEVKIWREEHWDCLSAEMQEYMKPTAVAKGAAPTAIILGFASIGSLIGATGSTLFGAGPGDGFFPGFAAGGLLGKVFTGSAKSDEAAKKLENALTPKDENAP